MNYKYNSDWLSLQFEDKVINFDTTERVIRYNREVVIYYLEQDLPNFLKIKKIEEHSKINKDELILGAMDLENCIRHIFGEYMKVYRSDYIIPQVYLDVSLKDELLIVIENEYYRNCGKYDKITEIRKYQIELSVGEFILNLDELLYKLFNDLDGEFCTHKPIRANCKQLFLDKLLALIDALKLFKEITITVNREE